MIVNRRRGEISANIGGTERCLCLTLGALAGLEDALGAGDLQALAERLAAGRLSARDLLAVIHAGLAGGGNDFTLEDVAGMTVEGGLSGYASIAAELLKVTFGDDGY